jgi:hypothetical protein
VEIDRVLQPFGRIFKDKWAQLCKFAEGLEFCKYLNGHQRGLAVTRDIRPHAASKWRRAASLGLRRSVIVLIVAVVAGCVSNRAIPEFKLYLSTYAESSATVTAVLDEFEGVELKRARDLMQRTGISPLRMGEMPATERGGKLKSGRERIQTNGFDVLFHIEDAVYHAANSTPPITKAFRRAFAAVGAYNTALDAYAEGRALDEVKTELSALGGAIGALGDALGGAAKIGSMFAPGGGLVSAGLSIIDNALEAGSKEAFRNALIDLEPTMQQILGEMREAAPAMFELMTSTARAAVKDAPNAEARAPKIQEIEKYRAVMSNWVVALDAASDALASVVVAIKTPDTALSLLSDLSLTAANAASVADGTRRLLGEIRTD